MRYALKLKNTRPHWIHELSHSLTCVHTYARHPCLDELIPSPQKFECNAIVAAAVLLQAVVLVGKGHVMS